MNMLFMSTVLTVGFLKDKKNLLGGCVLLTGKSKNLPLFSLCMHVFATYCPLVVLSQLLTVARPLD